jgi:hypothetical protein
MKKGKTNETPPQFCHDDLCLEKKYRPAFPLFCTVIIQGLCNLLPSGVIFTVVITTVYTTKVSFYGLISKSDYVTTEACYKLIILFFQQGDCSTVHRPVYRRHQCDEGCQ